MTPEERTVLEVCVASLDDAVAAVDGGADRLELNSAIELGGLTPSHGLLTEVVHTVTVPVIAMIRPRGAGFQYNASELRVMMRDAERLLELGAAGIAFGVLTSEFQIDLTACRELIHLAGARETVFHRAFDLVQDPVESVEQLADLGISRLLTSGQAQTALDGAALIRQIRQQAAGRFELLPAAGVRPETVIQLLEQTGCDQVHGSFRKSLRDPAGTIADSQFGATDRDQVAAVRRLI